MLYIPYRDHIVVHLLELLLGGVECVWWGVELVGFEAFIRKIDFEGLIILLLITPVSIHIVCIISFLVRKPHTSGTCSFLACDEAASVVTRRFGSVRRGIEVAGKAPRTLSALENMTKACGRRRVWSL